MSTVRQISPEDDVDYGGDGWVLFAGLMLAMLGTLNLIEGIAAVSNSTFFVNDAKFVFADLNTWGWLLIAIGVVQGLAALGVWMKTPGIRWIGVLAAGVNLLVQMLFISAYPFWGVALITLDFLVIYGLIAHGAARQA